MLGSSLLEIGVEIRCCGTTPGVAVSSLLSGILLLAGRQLLVRDDSNLQATQRVQGAPSNGASAAHSRARAKNEPASDSLDATRLTRLERKFSVTSV